VNQQQAPNHRDGFRNAVGAVVFVARAMALSVEVFLHRTSTFGERYVGLQAGAALLIIFFWPVLCEPGHNLDPLFGYLGLVFCMLLCIRARIALRRRRGGPQPHSYYSGTPWLMRFTGRMSELKVKTEVEPFFVMIVGMLMVAVSPPLGGYLVMASLGLLITTKLAADYERKRALDMHDAHIAQRNVVDRFRDMRGEP